MTPAQTDPEIHIFARQYGFAYEPNPDETTLLEPESAMLMASTNNTTLAITGQISHLVTGTIADYPCAFYTAQATGRADEQPNGDQIIASLSLRLPSMLPFFLLAHTQQAIAYEPVLIKAYGDLRRLVLDSALAENYLLGVQADFGSDLKLLWESGLAEVWQKLDSPCDMLIVDETLSLNIVVDQPDQATYETLLELAQTITPILDTTVPQLHTERYAKRRDMLSDPTLRKKLRWWLSN